MAYYLRSELRDRVFHLWNEGRHDKAEIARRLGLARSTVVKVMGEGPDWKLPSYPSYLDAHAGRIRELFVACESVEGVRRELAAEGIVVPYGTLFTFVRRQGLKQMLKPRGAVPAMTVVRLHKVLRVLRELLVTLEGEVRSGDSNHAEPDSGREHAR